MFYNAQRRFERPASGVLSLPALDRVHALTRRARRTKPRAWRGNHVRRSAAARRKRPRRSWKPRSGSRPSRRCSSARARSGRTTCSRSWSKRRAARAPTFRFRPRRPTSTPFRRTSRSARRAITRSRTASAPTAAGTRWSWSRARTRTTTSWAATSRASLRSARCSDRASTISGTRPSESHGGDLIYFQGHSSPGIYARAQLEGRLSEEQIAQLPPRGRRQGHLVLPAPLADARLLAVSHRVDGPGADPGDLHGALPEVPARARAGEHREPQGVVLLRRRRDGRARVARRDRHGGAREARQPDLHRQLQPAAARRPGARQRQDHPGARGRLPRRRLERDQAHLGLVLGPAAGARQGRAAAAPDAGDGRRRVPELQGERRRVRAQVLLRQVPEAARDGLAHDRRGHLAAEPRRARSAQDLRRLRGGDEARGPADRDPRQDDQGLRPGQAGPGEEPHAPVEEGRRGDDPRHAGPHEHSDP